MNIEEALEIMETELSRTQEDYNSALVAERLRNKKNDGSEEERYEGVNLAVQLFKALYLQGKEDCLDCLNSRKSSINPHRTYFLEGYNFILQIAEQWEP